MPDQRSLTDQIKDVLRLANKAGLYDAADWITQHYGPLRCTCVNCDNEIARYDGPVEGTDE